MKLMQTRRGTRFVAFVATLALGAAVISCGSDEPSTGTAGATATDAVEQTFVGKVDDSETFVAIVTDGEQVLAYLCDSEKTWNYLEGAGDDDISAGDASSPTVLDATRSGDSITGSITLPGDGTTHAFTATLATGDAGFFTLEQRSGDTVTQGGWIKLADGSVRGKQVAVNLAGDNVGTVEPDGAGGDGSTATTVPPGAEPASLLGLAACGVAGARVAIAVNRYNRDPSAANLKAVNDAVKAANARCAAGAAS